MSKNTRKLPGEIICETILQENPRKNIQKKIREEYSKESPLKNIQKQYLSKKNPRKLPGEKIWVIILKKIRKKISVRKPGIFLKYFFLDFLSNIINRDH